MSKRLRKRAKASSKVRTKPASTKARKPSRKPVRKPARKLSRKPTRKPVRKPTRKPAQRPARERRPPEKLKRKVAAKPITKPIAKPIAKPIRKAVLGERRAQIRRTVRKITSVAKLEREVARLTAALKRKKRRREPEAKPKPQARPPSRLPAKPRRRPPPKPVLAQDADAYIQKVRKALQKKSLTNLRGGAHVLDSNRSSGMSERFSVRKRLTSTMVERILAKVQALSYRLDQLGLPLWAAWYSVFTVGRPHPRLPGYKPLSVKGLHKKEQAYVTFATTSHHRTEEAMRADLAHQLYGLVTDETVVVFEQASVSTFRHKAPEERVEWFQNKRRDRAKRRPKSRKRGGRRTRR